MAIVFGRRGEQLVVADDGECVALLHHGANEAKNSRDFGTTVDEVANEDRLSLTMFPWTVELVGIAAFVAELLQQADEEAVFAVNVADDFEAGESWRRNSWFHSKPIRSGLGSDNRFSDAKSFRICLSQQEPIVCSFESRECPFIGLFGLLCLFSFSVLRLRGAVTNLDWSQNRPEKPRERTQSNGPRSGRGRCACGFGAEPYRRRRGNPFSGYRLR